MTTTYWKWLPFLVQAKWWVDLLHVLTRYIITTCSNIQVTRTKEVIAKHKMS